MADLLDLLVEAEKRIAALEQEERDRWKAEADAKRVRREDYERLRAAIRDTEATLERLLDKLAALDNTEEE